MLQPITRLEPGFPGFPSESTLFYSLYSPCHDQIQLSETRNATITGTGATACCGGAFMADSGTMEVVRV
jgi:hypothetical protein